MQVLERERASQMGVPSPIHDTIEDTHLNYNRCVCFTTRLGSSVVPMSVPVGQPGAMPCDLPPMTSGRLYALTFAERCSARVCCTGQVTCLAIAHFGAFIPYRCVAEVLEHVAGHGAEVMVATHNQASIEATVALMGQLGIEPDEKGVCMGQLLGMADHLTFTLGRNGYRVCLMCLDGVSCSSPPWPVQLLC
jgi:Proline dehydrogenase